MKEDGYFIVFGTITAILNADDWWYTACKCNKAVTRDEGMYYCERCFSHVVNVIPRYKLMLSVQDDSGSTTFVVFDREGSFILKKSCSYLLELLQSRFPVPDCPSEFDELLIGRSFLFKVEAKTATTSNFDTSFKVSKICQDPVIIAKFAHPVENPRQVNNLGDPEFYSVENDFLNVTPRKSIEQLKDCIDGGMFVVLATIKGFNNGSDWWYASCRCNGQVTPDSGLYYCAKCNSHVINVVPRYRIKLRVIDQSDSATFVLWDHQAFQILRKSCSEMLRSVDKLGGLLSHPAEFNKLLNEKQILFKVEVNIVGNNAFEPSYKVIEICQDVSVIAKFKELDPNFFKTEPDMTVGISLGENSLSMEFIDIQSSSISKDLMNQFNDVDGAHVSQITDEVPHIAPAKRLSNENQGSIDGDLSTTKMKSAKVEKN